ncbi:MAG: hypothetical protein AAGI70_16555 [Pseudomonadota bacterium]
MPRIFVNSMANFVVQGGMVSFTLQDQPMAGPQGTPEAEPVANIIMTEQEFAQMLRVFDQHKAAFEQQFGRPLGQVGPAAMPGKRPAGPSGGGMKIRPKA